MIPTRAPQRFSATDEDAWRGQLTDAITNLERRPQQDFTSADRGDTSITLNAGTDVPIQRFLTNLTANRTVTLGTGANGAWFTVVRATPSAANSLDIGGLKTFAGTNLWCDVGHDGTAWYLIRAGSL